MPQVPSATVADARSIVRLDASSPEAASLPLPAVKATDGAVYHGPPVSAIDCPAGASASAEIVIVSPAVRPAPLVAVIGVCARSSRRSQARMSDCTIQFRGSVCVPGIDRIISCDTSRPG